MFFKLSNSSAVIRYHNNISPEHQVHDGDRIPNGFTPFVEFEVVHLHASGPRGTATCTMRVFYGLDQLPQFKNPVITIGTFDGVHLGHASIIDRLKKKAAQVDGESIIITFDPHPRRVLSPSENTIELLTTLDEKITALSHLHIDHLVVVPFTLAFADLSARDYIGEFIVKHFHPNTIIIGYDHHFGKNREGNYRLMEAVREEYGYTLEEIPVQEIEHSAISSTRIRKALHAGDIVKANDYLGKPYSLQGTVVHGEHRGRSIGFPTANISVAEQSKLIPANGVYAVQVVVSGTPYQGMMNIGFRPTIAINSQRSLEVNLFGFEGDLYGQILKIEFIARLRDEQKFEDIEQLKQQLERDKILAMHILNA